MPRTVNELKTAAAGFLNRDASAFVVGSFDVLLQACNNARLYVERTVNLEMARVLASVSVNLSTGGALSSAVLSGTATAVSVKHIKWAGIALADDATTIVPIKIYNRDDYLRRVQRKFANASTNNAAEFEAPNLPFGIFRLANQIYIVPASGFASGTSSATVYMDVFKWMDSYVNGTETDFLLDYCFDYMLFRTISELNYFLKEDQRVALSTQVVKDAWESLKAWNAMIVEQSDDVTLE
jgi:hypothetical protein